MKRFGSISLLVLGSLFFITTGAVAEGLDHGGLVQTGSLYSSGSLSLGRAESPYRRPVAQAAIANPAASLGTAISLRSYSILAAAESRLTLRTTAATAPLPRYQQLLGHHGHDRDDCYSPCYNPCSNPCGGGYFGGGGGGYPCGSPCGGYSSCFSNCYSPCYSPCGGGGYGYGYPCGGSYGYGYPGYGYGSGCDDFSFYLGIGFGFGGGSPCF